jgi:hypothetical protein
MCMLTFYRPGAQPDETALRNGSTYNDDGHGFAIIARKPSGRRYLIIRHGMHFNRVFDDFKTLRAEHPDGPALFHSRLATAGVVNEYGCHPFRIYGDRRSVLAHNGVFPASVQPEKGDPRSDTRIVAEEYAPGVNWDNADDIQELEQWMGRGNALVILTTNPAFERDHYILNEAKGTWEGDTWYSNYDFLDPSWRYGGWYGADKGAADKYKDIIGSDWRKDHDPDYRVCWKCDSDADVEQDAALCCACSWCLDCDEHWNDCQCYVPEGQRIATGPYVVTTTQVPERGEDEIADVVAEVTGREYDETDEEAGAAARTDIAREAVLAICAGKG